MVQEIDLSQVDLNLLVLFDALMREQHVGRTAARLHLSPSAVSHGLARLRRVLHDLAGNGCGGTAPNGVVGVLLGKGDGTFGSVMTSDSGGKDDVSLTLADVDGDGSLDLFVAHACDASGDCSAPTVSELEGNGDGTFQSPVVLSTGRASVAGALSVRVADLNEDCEPDLLVANGDSVGVLLHERQSGSHGRQQRRCAKARRHDEAGRGCELSLGHEDQPGFE